MEDEITIVGLVLLIALTLAGIPIYIGILGCSMIILVVGLGIDPIVPIGVMFGRLNNIILLAVPLFVLLGQILAHGGAGKSLIRLLNAFMGHIPGGPAYALVFASVVLASMCADPISAVAAFGPLMIPLMVGLGYSESFAVGLLLCSASLAPLIPPNITAIIYAYIASPVSEEKVQVMDLWTACIIPGVILAFLLCVFILIHSRRGHFRRLPSANWTERWHALMEAWPVAITPVVVLGPLYAGWATPTEISAIGLIYVILISAFVYRGLDLKIFWRSCVNTLRVLGAIFLIIASATLLTIAILYANVPQDVTSWISDMGLSWWTFMLMMIVVYTIMGMFLDPTSIVLVSVPMLMSTINDLEISVVMYGVFTILAVNLAGITPPYGLIIFASQSILGRSYTFIVRACILFYPAMFIGILLVVFIPELCTWLPTVI